MKKQIAIILCALLSAMPITASAQCTSNPDNSVNVNNRVVTCIQGINLSDVQAQLDSLCANNANLSELLGSCGNSIQGAFPGSTGWNFVFDKFCGVTNQKPDVPSDDEVIPPEYDQTVPNEDISVDKPVTDDSTSDNNNTIEEAAGSGDSQTKPEVENSEYVAEVVRLVNVQRANNGLSALAIDATLCNAASKRAVETVSSFSHTRPNGTSCFTVLDEYGVSYRGAGENIAMGQPSPSAVVDAWMNSEGHRANILNGSFTKIGVGCHSQGGTLYWSQLFTY